MSDDIKRILIIDDSPEDIQFVMQNLDDEFAVLVATNGEKGLELAVKDPKPDVILMDVVMPEMGGYEACSKLKENPETKDIDVIFVSANDTTDEKLAGYEAGGSDYLIKPVQTSELREKVKLAIKNKAARLDASKEKDSAMQAAMTAILDAGELGVIVDFMRRSFTVNNVHDLARLVVEATAGYGLINSVQIRTPWEIINTGSVEPLPPLEQELLTRLKDSGRIHEKDNRLILNFEGISQLIKNLPEDEAKRGRLRDHLAILLEGANARLQALILGQHLESLIVDSKDTLQNIHETQKEQKQKNIAIMDEVMLKIQHSFMSYGLTEDQENVLLDIVENGVEKSLDNFEQGLKIDNQMQTIVKRLESFKSA